MTPEQQNFNWIKNIIDSTNTPFQAYAVFQLIEIFYASYGNKDLAKALATQLDVHRETIRLI